MEQKAILKKHQKDFLKLVIREPYLLKRFYWTGGTVLAEFYLKHRESEDIDLFSEKQEIHLPSINKFIGVAGTKLKAKKITHRKYFGLHTYFLHLPRASLKVDFNYYPFPRINRKKKWRGLEIDSLEDIAVNKIQTLSTNPRERDFIDLFFIFKKKNYSLGKLIILAKTKFDWHIDPIQLGQSFTEVIAVKDVPKMLVPFQRKEMEEFFLKEAKKLGTKIFR
ncbi:nucleotidyl transferase AbiEii/AbiGii toxin family protein [Candidatus Shapirobacteria bacterium]|nr:nucleotidyl transferase AbiEii/AbiGii toxin family protein [Candidatus Shapirobacteria bacterium]